MSRELHLIVEANEGGHVGRSHAAKEQLLRSGAYGKTDDAQSVAAIQAAIERGVTLLDTGDFYGSGHNELLIGKAIAGVRDQVQLSVKFGMLRGPGRSLGGIDARPAAVKNFLGTPWYGSARITSTCIVRRAWIRRRRSKTRSARSPIW